MTQPLSGFLEDCFQKFNTSDFIQCDPISVPHLFTKKQDIEIAAFWTAMLAWGQRNTIIKNAQNLMRLMDNAPHDFVCGHTDNDLKRFLSFKHRTFQPTDTLYFLHFFKHFYNKYESLEMAFAPFCQNQPTVEKALIHFHDLFFALPDAPARTRKHVATPQSKSTCKRLNMFLRWMVRRDNQGVDFGLWNNISPHQLLIPLDVHVDRVARKLGLIQRPQTDWQTVLELTDRLSQFDKNDPVKYDYALFGLGIKHKPFLN